MALTRVLVEVMDLREVPPDLMRKIRRASFGEDGWMTSCIDQILQGYATRYDWVEGYGVVSERVDISYHRAHALVARDEGGKFLGWAMVRHPKRVIKVRDRVWEGASFGARGSVKKMRYGGRRPDFMVYVNRSHRKKRVARQLLLVAYNNFGKLDAYPHDEPSSKFYARNKRFAIPVNTRRFSTAQFRAREIF